jgi:hypothetical protein
MLLAPLLGAGLLFALGVLHSLLGERYVLRPLLVGDLPPFMGRPGGVRGVLRVSWHLLSVAWWGVGAVLAYAAAAGPDAVGAGALRILAGTVGATGAIILVASRGRHPAWVGLGVAAVCAWLTSP